MSDDEMSDDEYVERVDAQAKAECPRCRMRLVGKYSAFSRGPATTAKETTTDG